MKIFSAQCEKRHQDCLSSLPGLLADDSLTDQTAQQQTTHMTKVSWIAAIVASALGIVSGKVDAKPLAGDAEIDRAVTMKLASLYGIHSNVVAHLDLTGPFGTASQWTLVIGKQPDNESTALGGAFNKEGAISICFVKNVDPDCSEERLLEKYREQKITFAPEEGPFYTMFASQVVHSMPGSRSPLLELKTCSIHGGNGSCGISTFLMAYDRRTDAFRTVFFNFTGSNNNEATRFVEHGPLLGYVIVANPTSDAPFRYFVEVYKRTSAGEYTRALKYRSRTGYGDGNPLPVIDSEMPELRRRLGLWKTGNALPVPPVMPEGCSKLALSNGIEWCETKP